MISAPLERCRTAALTVLGVLAALGSACVSAEVDEVGAGAIEPMATSSTVTQGSGTLEVGVAIATPRGNTVALLEAAASDGRVHGLVEACAGPAAAGEVGVSLSFFGLQLQDGSLAAPIQPGDAREPALRTREIPPGTCTVGWLTFDVDDQVDEARYLVFGSRSASTRWDLGELG